MSLSISSAMKLSLSPRGGGWTPARLFAGGEAGTLIDRLNPAQGYLFQDKAGMSPANSAGQLIGLALDKSQGPMLADIADNGGFDTDTDWTKQTGWTISGGAAVVAGGTASYSRISQAKVITLGTWIKVTIVCDDHSDGYVYLRKPRGSNITDSDVRADGVGAFTYYLNVSSENNELALANVGNTADIGIASISVEPVPGLHAVQATNDDYRATLQDSPWHLDDDEINDALNVDFPNDTYDIMHINSAGTVTTLSSQALSGATNILYTPQQSGFLAINRTLTAQEITQVTAYWGAMIS